MTYRTSEHQGNMWVKQSSARAAPTAVAILRNALAHAQEGIGEAEEARDKLRAAQRELEARMSKVSQVGTRIGDRLQVRHLILCYVPYVA